MSQTEEQHSSLLTAVSNAMVALHKEQFGRGPTRARSYFAGPDTLVCTMEDVLLPAERKMVEMGDDRGVRDSRTAFQVATAAEFVDAIEGIVTRRVRSFASAIDPVGNVVFENFYFEREASSDGDGAAAGA